MLIDRKLAALGDPMRRRTVELLGERPLRVGEIAAALELPQPATSKHLKVLRDAHMVEESHPDYDARVRIYALRADGLDDLKHWLQAAEAMWSRQLAAFKRHAERNP